MSTTYKLPPLSMDEFVSLTEERAGEMLVKKAAEVRTATKDVDPMARVIEANPELARIHRGEVVLQGVPVMVGGEPAMLGWIRSVRR